jgi:hypothetical protein
MRILYGEYKPDQPTHLNIDAGNNGQPQYGLTMADGVYPIANGYAPLGQFASASNGALGATCYGAAAYRTSGTNYIFAATSSKIRRYQSSGYTDLKTGLTTTVTIGMRFCVYGAFMLMTNGSDPIQKFDPASPTVTSNLGGSPPTARFIATVRGFVVAGYTGGNSLTVAWSDNGTPTTWTPAAGNEAGSQVLDGGGDITGVVGGEYGLVFQENRILRMSYTADDAIWQFDEISSDIGCIAPWSLATYGKISFFLSAKGFMACDGVTVQAIGAEKVDRTFLALLDRTYLDNMSAAVDPTSNLYFVAVPTGSPTSKVYIYNYALQKWTTASISQQRMFSSLSLGTTLESLDAIYGTLDAIPVSLDSAAFRGGAPLLMLFNGSSTLGRLSGSAMAAVLIDGRKELVPGYKSRIKAVRPLADIPAATVTMSLSDNLAGTETSTAHTSRSAGGIYRMRESANLSRVRLDVAAGTAWSYCQGYDIDAVQGGHA